MLPFDVVGIVAKPADFKPYLEGRYRDHEVRVGYAARMSAPGYMDTTPWSFHTSKAAAIKHLRDYYGNED